MSSSQRKFQRRGAQPAPTPPLRHDYERDKAAVAWCLQENNPHDPFVVRPATILAAAQQLACSAKDATGLVEDMRRMLREVGDLGLPELDMLSKWYSQGMPTLDIEEKLAASLLATNAGTLEDQLRPPFDSVLVRVPGRLCGPIESVRISRRDDVWFFCCNTEEDLHLWTVSSVDLEQLKAAVFEADEEVQMLDDEAFPDEEDAEERAKQSAQRLAINALLMMEHRREAVSSRREKTTNHKGRRGPPSRYFFTLTAPVVHDMRSVVREYVAHGGKSPTVQCVVAGHWKMQRCGPGGSERKRIFIEPYWRGPEDAPIALRPHVLKQ